MECGSMEYGTEQVIASATSHTPTLSHSHTPQIRFLLLRPSMVIVCRCSPEIGMALIEIDEPADVR